MFRSPSLAPRKRRGITLLEVVVSLAIFLFSLTAITQLVIFSSDNIVQANLRTQAGLLCQSKLNEFLAGTMSFDSSSGTFDVDPGWQWSVDCTPDNTVSNLWQVNVVVKREHAGRTVEVSLSQLVFDPTQRGSTIDVPATNASGSNNSGSNTTGTPSSNAGSSSSGGM
jgi:Tfp pilus assembly protein PilV